MSRGRSTTATSTAKNSAASTKGFSPTPPATTPPPELSPSTSPPATTARSQAPTTHPRNSSLSSWTKHSTRSSTKPSAQPTRRRPCWPSPWSTRPCGSGHFVVAAARRIATALAAVRTGDTEPGPTAVRAATADVIERCIYGVDLNDLAIEITKVALWLEAFDGSRPFPFLDAHLKVGNSLLGTTPALLRENIPDAAFTALGDDDKDWTSKLKARNKAERAQIRRPTLDV